MDFLAPCVLAWYDSRIMTKLTIEQRDDLQQHGNQPVPVIDPQSNAVYFLIPSELFERLRPLLEDEPFDIRETYQAQSDVAGKAGWDDPEMDVYDDYDSRKLLP